MSMLKKQKTIFLTLREEAEKRGLQIIPLKMREIPVHEGVRLKCLVPLCEFYSVCRVCPPHLPSVSEFRRALTYFSQAFLLVLRHEAVSREEVAKPEIALLQAVQALEKTAWQHGYYRAMGLAVGGCKLCERCAPLNEPCRHPFQARPSPEGLGIDLTLLARRKGLPLAWPPTGEYLLLGMLLL